MINKSLRYLSIQKFKTDFKNCGHGNHLGFPIGMILASSDIQITPILTTKFPVSWSFGPGEEVLSRFSRWCRWQPSWITDKNEVRYFLSKSRSDTSYQVSNQLTFRFRKRSSKKIFKMAAMATILSFRSE